MVNYLAKRFAETKRYKFTHAQSQKFVAILKNERYGKTCDIGCGKGYWSYLLSKYNIAKEAIYACDEYSDFQADEIRLLNPAIEIRYADVTRDEIPFDSESFDLVFSVDVIEHVEDDKFFLWEHIRVAKPGATILIVTPNYWRPGNIFYKSICRLKFPRKMGDDVYGSAVHLREYTKNDLLLLAQSVSGYIKKNSLRILPCWVGIPLTNIGSDIFPRALSGSCHSWFLIFKKIM